MRRQARLGLGVASVFVLLLILLPVANLVAPDLMRTSIGGFTLSWLMLGVLFFPMVWLLSRFFVVASERVEEQLTQEEQR